MSNEEKNEQKKPEKNVFQRVSRKVADTLKKIIFYIFFNPIVMVSLGFVVGARMYEAGFLGIQGTTVWISGVCETREGAVRGDLAQDQMIVSSVNESENTTTIEGMIRKTRENIICDLSKSTIDRLGPLDQMMKPKIAIPEIKKLDVRSIVKEDYSKYMNKKLLMSGLCRDDMNKKLAPFRDMVVDVTNVKKSELDPSIYYFTGIREDNKAVVCNIKDVTYAITEGKEEVVTEKKVSYIGKKVFVTGLCFPDSAVYEKIGKKPDVPYYDMQKLPVEVTEDKYSKTKGKIVALRGSILDNKTTVVVKGKTVPIFGHKIICDDSDSPLNVSLEDDNVKVELKKVENK